MCFRLGNIASHQSASRTTNGVVGGDPRERKVRHWYADRKPSLPGLDSGIGGAAPSQVSPLDLIEDGDVVSVTVLLVSREEQGEVINPRKAYMIVRSYISILGHGSHRGDSIEQRDFIVVKVGRVQWEVDGVDMG